MKLYLLLISLLIAPVLFVNAPKEGSIKGIIKDSVSGLPLGNATVTLLLAKDSSLVSFSRTGSNGFFSIRNIENGAYRLLITYVGYVNISKDFVITSAL